jgi:hypothetical protein
LLLVYKLTLGRNIKLLYWFMFVVKNIENSVQCVYYKSNRGIVQPYKVCQR